MYAFDKISTNIYAVSTDCLECCIQLTLNAALTQQLFSVYPRSYLKNQNTLKRLHSRYRRLQLTFSCEFEIDKCLKGNLLSSGFHRFVPCHS